MQKNDKTSLDKTSLPTHFKELTAEHPLPEIEDEKKTQKEKKSHEDYSLPHPIW